MRDYEAPAITEIGRVEELTLVVNVSTDSEEDNGGGGS